MQGKAVWAALSKYLSSLVMTILAPLQWVRLLKLAKQHHALDPKAQKKIIVGIVAGLALAGLGTVMLTNFEADAEQGLYETLSGRLSGSIGNDFYNDQVKAQEAAAALVAKADAKIAEAQAAGDAEAEQTWRDNRVKFVADHNAAAKNVADLSPNHKLWLAVNQSLALHHDDAGAKQLIEQRFNVDYPGLDAGAAQAFQLKDESHAQMQTTLLLFAYPGLIGVLWAPVVMMAGHVLKTTFVPSDTVGYKQYPGGAAAWFLLFGAFGIPALFFAAFVLQDFADRTETGQISL